MHTCIFLECRYAAEAGSTKCIFHRCRIQCKAIDCRNQAYARGLCVRHGARKQCRMEHCIHMSRVGGLCARHHTAQRKKQEIIRLQYNEPVAFNVSTSVKCSLNALECAILRVLLQDDETDETKISWSVAETNENLKNSTLSSST